MRNDLVAASAGQHAQAATAPLVVPPAPVLAVASGCIWFVDAERVRVLALATGELRTGAGEARAVVGSDDAAWIATVEGRAIRYPHGDLDAPEVVNGSLAGSISTIIACRVGEPAVVMCGREAIWIRGREVERLGPITGCVVPVPGGWIARSGRRLVLHRDQGELPLRVPSALSASGTLCGGAALLDGRLAALDLRGRDSHHLVTIDLRTGELRSCLRLVDARHVAWVEGRAQAVIARDRDLQVIDLERGRSLALRALDAPPIAIAADARGEVLAIKRVEATALDVIDYANLVSGVRPRPTEPSGAGEESGEGPQEESATAPSDAADVTIAVACEPPDPARVAPAPCASLPAPCVEPAPAVELRGALRGLGLGPPPAALDAVDQAAFIADAFALVAGLCRRAAAIGWDSGRLGGQAGLPHAAELAALLDDAEGAAPEALRIARQREAAAARRFARWERPDAPLAALAAELALSPLAGVIALIVAAPYVWQEIARAYAIVASDPARPVVDEALILELLGIDRATRRRVSRELDDDAPLIRRGVVIRAPGPRASAALTVSAVVVLRLAGERFDAPGPAARQASVALEDMLAPPGRVAELVVALREPRELPARVVVRGRSGSGRRTLAAALAARCGRLTRLIELGEAGEADRVVNGLTDALRDVALRGHLPCISGIERLEPAGRERVQRVLDGHPGPLVVRCERGALAPLAPGHLVVDLDPLDAGARRAAWRAALAARALPVDAAGALAARWSVGPGTIAQVVASLSGAATAGELTAGACDRAVRAHRADRIGAIATRVEQLASWDDLVLPDDALDSLRELASRVRHRDVVLGAWGMARVTSAARGVTALFQGAPGTGKSLAAGVLARELGYELYRVDLSRILSRWLGETEKNLAAVFDAAEDGETILLFDEADALFGKRTEVKSSHDRYANAEINYLLQRLDAFDGIAILTTNFGTAVDPAFRRRLALSLQFPFPDDAERERLWRAHVPATVPTAGDLELASLAARFKLSGGYIRNAALRACYLAAAERSPVTAAHLVRAVRLEYRDTAKVAEGGRME